MNLHVRIDKNNPQHTTLTVFANGANTGKLVMTSVEAFAFITALEIAANSSQTFTFKVTRDYAQ
jgi:hypothetical protein